MTMFGVDSFNDIRDKFVTGGDVLGFFHVKSKVPAGAHLEKQTKEPVIHRAFNAGIDYPLEDCVPVDIIGNFAAQAV